MTAINPWEIEPDSLKWIDPDTGYRCFIRRGPLGALCGYVRVPKHHPLYRVDYWHSKKARRLDAHGGITFSGSPVRMTGGMLRGHWFGFDCGHYMDLAPAMPIEYRRGTYREMHYVKEEVLSLARQLKRMERS